MGAVIDRVHELGMAVIGEQARTTYVESARLGANAFVHTSRYSLDLAPDELRRGVEAEPFSNEMGRAKWRYYKMLPELANDRKNVAAYGRKLAEAGAALMPTFSLNYLDRPGHGNPWDYPVSAIIDARDVHWPADKITGEHDFTAEEAASYRALAEAEMKIDRVYFEAGCHYIAGSGADVWGTMPGISLHTELEALVAIGHSPRQALAAATSNFARVMGWSELGEIDAGRRADVLVLNQDPREDVKHLQDIRTVYLAGRALDPAQLMQPVAIADGQLLTRTPMEIPAELLDAEGAPLPEYSYLDSMEISDITYMSDGLRVVGHLVVPKGEGPFPCLVYNRGGNREFGANSPARIARRLAKYASWGYVAAASQYRGNAGGEGQEEFGGAEVADVINLIPLLGSIAQADTSRIGMIGYSRGGLMTYLSLTRTDRVDAAVIGGGVADSFFGIEDRPEMEEFVYSELVPNYWENKEAALKERSPLLWPEKLCKTTPLLLLHGSADWRVHPREGLDMADALYAAGHPFRFVFLEGADHDLSEYRDEVNQMIRHWLDRYVRDEGPLPNLEPHGP
jgi:dienelactone hydrolase